MAEHAGYHESIEQLSPETIERHRATVLRTYLFTEGPITEIEEEAT